MSEVTTVTYPGIDPFAGVNGGKSPLWTGRFTAVTRKQPGRVTAVTRQQPGRVTAVTTQQPGRFADLNNLRIVQLPLRSPASFRCGTPDGTVLDPMGPIRRTPR